jgi:hypothetical protein
MARKLLISRIGAGSITIALCAALPGCNLAIGQIEVCSGNPGSRNMSTVDCPDASGPDSARDTSGDSPPADVGGDR